MSREDIEVAIRDAFAGVRLGNGVSISIAELIDEWADDALVDSLLGTEPDEDWALIPFAELERAENIAHFDAEGLRYYLPALMLALLDHYEPIEMWCTGTLFVLGHRHGHQPPGFMESLTRAQLAAIVQYVKALPDLVDLEKEDDVSVRRAYLNFWARELDRRSSARG